MLIVILFIFLFTYQRYLNYIKKFLKKKQSTLFTKKNLYQWMKLSKKERFKLTRNDSDNYLNKRKDLLEKIRKEYKILKK